MILPNKKGDFIMDCSIFDRVYAGMLKSASEFQAGNQDETIEYHFDSQLEKVVSKYHLTDVAGQGPDSQKIIRMVEWMTQHCFHNGEFDNHIEPCAEKLLEFSFDHGKENGINCLSLSIALTECLLGLGICARAMSIMPMSPYDRDNHVVCEAYARDLGKWIMVDPTYGGYITDEQGDILNLMEMRKCLSNRQTLCYSENYNYNGDKVDPEWLTIYYAKDLFYLQCDKIQGYHTSKMENNPRLTFAPIGFDAKEHIKNHLDFVMDEHKDDKSWDESFRQRIFQRLDAVSLCYQHPKILYQEPKS